MKPTVLVDLDDTVVDLRGPWVQWLNATFNLDLTGEDLKDYYIEKCLPPEIGPKVYGFLNKKGLYRELQPLQGGVEGLNYLHEFGYDVMIATAPVRDPDSAADKLRWIKEWLPWMRRQNVFLCHRKELIRADCFIDDSPANIVHYRNSWGGLGLRGDGLNRTSPDGPLILTLDWPYNRSDEVESCLDLRAGGYDDTVTGWREMVKFLIERLPSSQVEAMQAGA